MIFEFQWTAAAIKFDWKTINFVQVNKSRKKSWKSSSSHFKAKMLRLILLFMLTHTAFAANHRVSFILDFLKAQNKPTHPIILQNCFAMSEKIELVKSSFNPTTFHRQDSLDRNDFEANPQYYLFILDLTCSQSPERIIQKVNTQSCCRMLMISIHSHICVLPFLTHTDR